MNINIDNNIKRMETRYKIKSQPLEDFIKGLEEKYSNNSKYFCKEEKTEKYEKTVIDREYVEELLENLLLLNGILGKMEFKRCKETFENILNDDDFEDEEDVMLKVHENIDKYIYGSDTKVSDSEWEYLEKYIIKAGYVEVGVKVGDNITPYKTYFKQPIPANGGTKNIIKEIQLQPYVFYFREEDRTEELKLCGKCTYYKGV